jgi:hypothetical protein
LDLYYLASNPNGYTSDTGTVTSVAATAGTGISISGSPITGAGTLTITNTAPDQTVSITGAGINAVSGTYPSFTITGTEVDGSVTNELQTISYNSGTNTLSLSDGGGTADLSNLDLVDSTRINATGDTALYYQNGVLISEFTNVLAICQTPLVTQCEIDFNAFQDSITLPDFEEGDDFNFTLGYNSTSRVITSQFTIPSGEPSLVELIVTSQDTLSTSVCSDTLTSSSGLLTCPVPY